MWLAWPAAVVFTGVAAWRVRPVVVAFAALTDRFTCVFCWQNYNWFDAASKAVSNVGARCPLVGDTEVDGAMPAAAQAVMKRAGPRL